MEKDKSLVHYFPGGRNFFKLNTGKTRHVQGVVEAFTQNGLDILVYSADNSILQEYEVLDGNFYLNYYFNLRDLWVTEAQVLIRKNWWVLIMLLLLPSAKRKAFVVLEVNGFMFERYVEKYRLYTFYQRFLRLHAVIKDKIDHYYAVNQSIASDIEQFDISEKIAIGYNGAPCTRFDVGQREDGELCFVFYGNYRKYNDFELIINACEEMEHNLFLIGFGEMEDSINRMIMDKRFVTNLGYMDSKSFLEFSQRHPKLVGLVPLKDNFNCKYLSPIKLGDYLANGMPVIISSNVDSFHRIIRLSAIYTYRVSDKCSLMDQMKNLISSPQAFDLISLDASKVTWSKTLKPITDLY